MSRDPPARRHISLLAQVERGATASLDATLTSLPEGVRSPLAAVPGTHYARWVVVGRTGIELLLFSVVADDPVEAYLRSLLRHMASVADRVWSHCAGWPGTADADVTVAWLAAHVIEPSLGFGTWQAAVEDIRAGLDLRERLRAFAVGTQGLEDAALQRAFVREFGP